MPWGTLAATGRLAQVGGSGVGRWPGGWVRGRQVGGSGVGRWVGREWSGKGVLAMQHAPIATPCKINPKPRLLTPPASQPRAHCTHRPACPRMSVTLSSTPCLASRERSSLWPACPPPPKWLAWLAP